ncbi:MAG: antA/AntB antirepressor family protein [Candidatus Arsenophonus phytopathogenicus]
MSNLINIETKNINGALIQTVNARDLHAFLEIGKDFTTWIKDRIKQYGFIENQDYIIVENLSSPISGSANSRQQMLKEYAISLDMAKELSMVERNEKGKQARLYFIECERQAKTATHVIPQTLPEALRLAAEMAEKVQHLSLVNKEQQTEIDSLKNLFQVWHVTRPVLQTA